MQDGESECHVQNGPLHQRPQHARLQQRPGFGRDSAVRGAEESSHTGPFSPMWFLFIYFYTWSARLSLCKMQIRRRCSSLSVASLYHLHPTQLRFLFVSYSLLRLQEQKKSSKLEESMKMLDYEMKKTDDLLYRMIPKPVAKRLRKGEPAVNTCEVRAVCVHFIYSGMCAALNLHWPPEIPHRMKSNYLIHIFNAPLFNVVIV